MEPIDGEPTDIAVEHLTRLAGRPRHGVVLGTRTVLARPEEVAPTRHWLAGLLAADHAAIADDVVLLACETVTNAIRHSDSARPRADGLPGTVTVIASEVRGAVRVEVADAGSASSAPRLAEDEPEAVNGRGLHLLDIVSGARWGSREDEPGRTVWFEIAADERGAPSGEP
jgi:anti-sigma regulatory factor (Ser/Thr protein kinase)